MPTASISEFDFPVLFWEIVRKSMLFFGKFFLSFLLLSIVTFIPFLAFELISDIYTIDLIEFFHGNFLDIVIFLTLPTIYMQGSIFPLPTIALFFQRFFASAVVISCIQFSSLVVFALLFQQMSFGIILISMIPYIYLIFAGFFLIIENSSRLISIRFNLINSIKLARLRFFSIFSHYFLITIITSLPFIIFLLLYIPGLPEFAEFKTAFDQQPPDNQLLSEKLLLLVESFNQPEFIWSRIGIHILFRPIKSLFLSFLFLGILFRLDPKVVKSFLGYEDQDSVSPSNEDIEESQDNP